MKESTHANCSATHVEMEDGRRVMLRADAPQKREAIAKALLGETTGCNLWQNDMISNTLPG